MIDQPRDRSARTRATVSRSFSTFAYCVLKSRQTCEPMTMITTRWRPSSASLFCRSIRIGISGSWQESRTPSYNTRTPSSISLVFLHFSSLAPWWELKVPLNSLLSVAVVFVVVDAGYLLHLAVFFRFWLMKIILLSSHRCGRRSVGECYFLPTGIGGAASDRAVKLRLVVLLDRVSSSIVHKFACLNNSRRSLTPCPNV